MRYISPLRSRINIKDHEHLRESVNNLACFAAGFAGNKAAMDILNNAVKAMNLAILYIENNQPTFKEAEILAQAFMEGK